MANDSKQYQEEEYLFSENEQTDPLNPTEFSSMPHGSTSAAGGGAPLKVWRKNLIIGIGLLFVVLLVYKVISSFFQPKEVVKQMPNIPTAVKSQMVSANISSISNTSNLPDNASAKSAVLSSVSSLHQDVDRYNQNRSEQRIAKLELTLQNVNTEINDLQNTERNLQSSLDSINAQLSQLNTTLAVLADKVQTQENRWQQAQKKAMLKKTLPAKPVIKRDTYYVIAIVPGRAWLKSSKGVTITVGEGKEIPGYGKVMGIDTDSGHVIMSSGDVIDYAPSDI